jgi:hypothetical protein
MVLENFGLQKLRYEKTLPCVHMPWLPDLLGTTYQNGEKYNQIYQIATKSTK